MAIRRMLSTRILDGSENRCSNRSLQTPPVSAGQHFVSGACTSQNTFISLEPGTKLVKKRYSIIRSLGRGGGFAAVYLAHDGLRREDVALKVADLGPCGSQVGAQQLKHEMAMYARIKDHRHVIRVHDLHTEPWGGSILLVMSMEYADGGSFREWLHDHRNERELRQTEGLSFFKQACYGAGSVHEAGLAHVDLKPGNCLFVDGILKISDFGIARCVQNIQVTCNASGTCNASQCGTPAYMSPEQCDPLHPDDLDFRSDIYSLGIMLFEILHPRCHPPFGGTYDRLRELHLNKAAPQLPGAGDNEARVIARCLEKDPADRYQDVWELFDDLEGNLHEDEAAVSTEVIPETHAGEEQMAIWHRACQSLSTGDFNEATRCCREMLTICPGHTHARKMLESLQAKYDQAEQIYKIIDRDLDHQGLTELIALTQEAVKIYPDHPAGLTVQTRLAVKSAAFRRCMEEGIQALQKGCWEASLTSFQEAQKLDVNGGAASRAIEFVSRIRQNVEEQRRYIDDAIRQGNRSRAMHLARSLDHYVEEVTGTIT